MTFSRVRSVLLSSVPDRARTLTAEQAKILPTAICNWDGWDSNRQDAPARRRSCLPPAPAWSAGRRCSPDSQNTKEIVMDKALLDQTLGELSELNDSLWHHSQKVKKIQELINAHIGRLMDISDDVRTEGNWKE